MEFEVKCLIVGCDVCTETEAFYCCVGVSIIDNNKKNNYRRYILEVFFEGLGLLADFLVEASGGNGSKLILLVVLLVFLVLLMILALFFYHKFFAKSTKTTRQIYKQEKKVAKDYERLKADESVLEEMKKGGES